MVLILHCNISIKNRIKWFVNQGVDFLSGCFFKLIQIILIINQLCNILLINFEFNLHNVKSTRVRKMCYDVIYAHMNCICNKNLNINPKLIKQSQLMALTSFNKSINTNHTSFTFFASLIWQCGENKKKEVISCVQ